MCIRDRENITKEDAGIYTVEVTAKNDKGTSMAVSTANVAVKEGTITPTPSVTPVSYTHLDVYKRQAEKENRQAR